MQRIKTPFAFLAIVALTLGGLGCAAYETAEEAPEAEPAVAEPVPLDRAILEDPSRPEEDRAQDEGRKALDVYDFVGIEPGMVVADLFPGGGYNTHLLSLAVGDAGSVKCVFGFYASEELFGGQLYRVPAVTERIENAGLTNVEMLMEPTELEPGSLDALIAVRNYHDVEWVFDGYTREGTVAAIYAALKPGGVVGIVEVDTHNEGWHDETHRLNKQVVISDFTAGGFELVAESDDLLANAEDDHSEQGFPDRHLMDRYVLKFQKPAM